MTQDEFEDMVMLKNKRMCDPPLDESEIDKQIECAVNFIEEQIAQENDIRQTNKTIFGTEEFWSDIAIHKQAFQPVGKYVKCLDCKNMIEPNPLEQEHYGHKVVIQ